MLRHQPESRSGVQHKAIMNPDQGIDPQQSHAARAAPPGDEHETGRQRVEVREDHRARQKAIEMVDHQCHLVRQARDAGDGAAARRAAILGECRPLLL